LVRWVLQSPSALGPIRQRQPAVHPGDRHFLRTADDVRNVVAGVVIDKPIFVRDVAEVSDGGEEPTQHVRYADGKGTFPAVTIAVSKRKGTNAVTVAEDVLSGLERLRGSVIPSDVEMTVTRNYGDTAKE
jgi:multidrug efflux pump subunit AcrB